MKEKFNKDQFVYNAHTSNVLYRVLGYNGANGIILLPAEKEDRLENRIVIHSDHWIYAKD